MDRLIFRATIPTLCTAVLLILVLTVPANAQAPAEPHKPVTIKDNAALWYWQAFNQMNGVDLDVLYEGWPPNIDKEKVELWINTEVFNSLHRGASQPACAWGVDFQQDGINALLPHLGPARNLAKMSGLRAEYYFQQGQINLAVDDLVAAMTLGRHLPNPGVIIDILVQISISELSQEVLSKNLYRLNRTQLHRLKQKLADLPPRKTTAQSIETEKYISDWLAHNIRESGIESLRELFVEDLASQDELENIAKQAGGDVEEIERLAEQMRGYYDQLQHIMTLSYDDVKPAEDALLEQITSEGNTLALVFLPAAGSVRYKELRHIARTQMVHAMIAYQLDGPEVFQKITDPYDGLPFEIEATESAVTLHSRMPDKSDSSTSVTFSGIKLQTSED